MGEAVSTGAMKGMSREGIVRRDLPKSGPRLGLFHIVGVLRLLELQMT